MFNTEEIRQAMQQETHGTAGNQPLQFLVSDPSHLLAIEDGYPFTGPNSVQSEVQE